MNARGAFTASAEPPAACDVLVLGSGAAGLVAACRAADAGHHVVLVERARSLGGSTAVSGGVIWVPGNHLMAAAGFPDTREDAVAYLTAVTRGAVPHERIEWFLRTAPEAVRYLCDETEVGLAALGRPDYRADAPGAVAGGRALDNLPFDARARPGLDELLRTPTYLPSITMVEREHGHGLDLGALSRQRAEQGIRTMGGALAGALALSAHDRGVTFVTGARATAMDRAGQAWDVSVASGGGLRRVRARRAVVLASGGFEWNAELQRAFLPAPLLPIGAPGNAGDGLLMALRAGAGVRDMTASWGVPAFQDPDARYDGRPTGRLANVELTRPGSVMVNAAGRRFVNEAQSYHDLTKVFREVDPATGVPRHSPAWLVYDSGYGERYPVAGAPPGTTPAWAVTRPTLRELAGACGIDADGLAATVEEFNADAAEGTDRLFARGSSVADRHLGDPAVEPNPCLAPIGRPPFTAVPVHAATLGTCGGVVTDHDGRVLSTSGEPVAGLFAAGNVAATPFGDCYPGGGTSLAAAVVRAYAIGPALAG
ncbi:FAD-dependent oxidoreductase [Nonomuraea cavernae]|uniref:FAD-binding protein n=1 Tax=Nonomuraea cavernae TaxID=2045107 RepID=A0A918DKK7_9ACTN|nr:FAD-dependent oxidoreductase [Nonomuraea cavernae]MCA2187934.1 FAD-dependent oxidoreductase [Nonomuraea cavernae]GGO72292.1 FAD-binding protein [Nonomuraea cavernae]